MEDEDYGTGESDPEDDALAASLGVPDAASLMRDSFASDTPMWPTPDDMRFLFSARYNGEAFRRSYLQAEYREQTHQVFTGIVDVVIEKKLLAFAANPRIYNSYAKRLEATKMQKDTVLAKARLFGIDVTRLDVGMLVYDVEKGLQSLVDELIPDHPDMRPDTTAFAERFMDNQLWSAPEQTLWRSVTAEKLASLYEYDCIATSIPLIRGLDEMIHREFSEGELRGQDPSTVYFGQLLSDEVVDYCLDAMDNEEYDGMPVDWVISDVISRSQQPDDDW